MVNQYPVLIEQLISYRTFCSVLDGMVKERLYSVRAGFPDVWLHGDYTVMRL